MVIVKDDSYLIKTRINVGHFFGREAEEAFVELREPTNKDLIRLKDASQAGEEALLAAFSDILPRVVTNHNLYKTEAELMTAAEVGALIIERLGIYAEVVGRYSEEVVFTLGSKTAKTSPGSPAASSAAS